MLRFEKGTLVAARLEKVALALCATRKGSYEELSESELVYRERSKGRNKGR